MFEKNRKSLAQNFLAKAHLARSLVRESSIDRNDIVYEIGPGKGILTEELGRRAKQVIAVEKDWPLYSGLRLRFARSENIVLHNADFLRFTIREPCYKVFANVPFNITSAVVRKLVQGHNPPAEAYLIVQKEAAERYMGVPTTTQVSVLLKPWHTLKITRSLRRVDFSPVPRVDIVMLHIKRKTDPLVPQTEVRIYERFVRHGFGTWKKNLKANYRRIFSHKQWRRLSRDLKFPFRAKPSELNFDQWLGLYEFFRRMTGFHPNRKA